MQEESWRTAAPSSRFFFHQHHHHHHHHHAKPCQTGKRHGPNRNAFHPPILTPYIKVSILDVEMGWHSGPAVSSTMPDSGTHSLLRGLNFGGRAENVASTTEAISSAAAVTLSVAVEAAGEAIEVSLAVGESIVSPGLLQM